MAKDNGYVAWFDHLDSGDVEKVGGKNASLGEMIKRLKKAGIRVPEGFATTADACWEFIEFNELSEKIQGHIESWKKEKKSLEAAGSSIRKLFRRSEFPEEINVVQGTVNPDEYFVFKPLLNQKRFKPIIGKSLGEKKKKILGFRAVTTFPSMNGPFQQAEMSQ